MTLVRLLALQFAAGTSAPALLGLSGFVPGAFAWNGGAGSCHIESEGGYVLPPNGLLSDVVLGDRFAVAAAGRVGLQIFSLQNPEYLQLAGFFNSTPSPAYLSLALSGKYAVVVDNNGVRDPAVRVIDVADPSKSKQVGVYPYSLYPETRSPLSVRMSGETAFVTYGDGSLNHPTDIDILTLANPAKPTRLGGYHFKGLSVADFAVSGKYLYAIGSRSGAQKTNPEQLLAIFDASDPLSGLRPISLLGLSNVSSVNHLTIQGQRAFVSATSRASHDDSSFFAVTVADPGNPKQVGYLRQHDAVMHALAPVGDTVFAVIDGFGKFRSGVQAIRVADGASPTVVGSANCSLPATGVIAANARHLIAGEHAGDILRVFSYACK